MRQGKKTEWREAVDELISFLSRGDGGSAKVEGAAQVAS
jgi:hypothetical protein